MIIREEQIGDCRMILGDCLQVMPMLGKVDAVVTDPPYGLGDKLKSSNIKSNMLRGCFDDLVNKGWDIKPVREAFDLMFDVSNYQIIWGGNYFVDFLHSSQCFLLWDKMNGSNNMADCELAWTSMEKSARIFRMHHFSSGYGKKQHPTQKPVPLIEWCIGHLPDDSETILDPFMGSGTTGVACAKMGRKFIGIDLDPDYFEIACDRVRKAYAQPDLFVAPPKPPTQEGFDL